MKKSLLKRIASGMLAVLLFSTASLGSVPVMADGVGTPYGKTISIKQLLSDYQFVAKDSITAKGHTVGAIATSGTASFSNTFGDGAVTPSYAENISGAFANGNYFSAASNYLGYYHSVPAYDKQSHPSNSLITEYTNTSPFLDFDSAFSSLQTESAALTTGATELTDANCTVLDGYKILDIPAGAANVKISAALYNEISVIRFLDCSINTDLRQYFTNPLTITFDGVANVKISGNYVAPENTKGATGTKIIAYNKSAANIYDALNGGMYNNNWKFMSVIKDGETVGNGQMSLTGMKLLWNCPDATAVSASCYNGHIVAPSAAIEISGGNFEGGVIGKTIDTGGDSEAHFYPYNAVPKNTGAATYSVSFVKQKTGDADTKLGGAKFNLYSSYTAASSATKDDTDATADYVGTKTSAVTTGAFAFDGLEAGSYFMKEVAAPANYELSDTIYKITVGTSGTAVAPATSASETGAALTATSNAYSIENALTPTASDIKLIKTVSGTNSAESDAKDAKFTLYTTSACSNIVQGTTETAASKVENDYTVTFKGENLNVNNTYYLKETTAPTGYTASTNIYECHIKADGTVEYRIWTSGNINTFSEDFPICDNVKNTPPDPNAYNVEYKKVDSQTKIALENCEFALYHDAACTNPVMKNGANYTAKSDANGITRFENIQAGKYYFKEISAPYGYTLNPQTYIVEIIAGTPPVITFGYLGGAQGLNQLSVPNDPISPVIPYNPSTPAITVPYNPPYISFPNELLPGGVKTYPVVPAVSDHEITVDVAPDAGILVEEMSVVTAVTTAPGAVSDAASDSPSAGTNIPWAAGTMLIAAIGVLLFAIKH